MNDPVNLMDPFGLQDEDCACAMNNLKKVVRDPGFQEAALETLSNAGAIVKSVAQIAVAEVATGLAGVMAGTPEIPALSKAAIEAASTLQSTLEKQAQLDGDVYSKTGHPKPCQSWWTKNQFWNWIETLESPDHYDQNLVGQGNPGYAEP